MKDLLKELFYIVDDMPIESDAFNKMCDIEDVLTKRLKGEEKQLFIDFVKAHNQAAEEYAINDFKRGFDTGFWFTQRFAVSDDTDFT
ncbi:MAG: hypothetical protein FWE74_10295 [Oscillospiraceae bacterium]|nr:hypothetical protein [Oscillospiraceae bacterium]